MRFTRPSPASVRAAFYLKKKETFESWYENPIDLPGRWYLQAIVQLFKENRLAKGNFVGLGRRLDLKDVICPVYLLAGEAGDITTPEQVFDAVKYLGTPPTAIEKKLVPGGHIGLHGLARPQGGLAVDRALDRYEKMTLIAAKSGEAEPGRPVTTPALDLAGEGRPAGSTPPTLFWLSPTGIRRRSPGWVDPTWSSFSSMKEGFWLPAPIRLQH